MQITCHTVEIHCHNRHAFGEYHITGHMKDHVNITKDHMIGHMTHHSLSPSYFVLGLSSPLLHMLSLITTGVLQKTLGGNGQGEGWGISFWHQHNILLSLMHLDLTQTVTKSCTKQPLLHPVNCNTWELWKLLHISTIYTCSRERDRVLEASWEPKSFNSLLNKTISSWARASDPSKEVEALHTHTHTHTQREREGE